MHIIKDFAIFYLICFFLIGFAVFPDTLGGMFAKVVAGYETMLPIYKVRQ